MSKVAMVLAAACFLVGTARGESCSCLPFTTHGLCCIQLNGTECCDVPTWVIVVSVVGFLLLIGSCALCCLCCSCCPGYRNGSNNQAVVTNIQAPQPSMGYPGYMHGQTLAIQQYPLQPTENPTAVPGQPPKYDA